MPDNKQKIDSIKNQESVTEEKPTKKRRHVRGIWAVTIIFVLCLLLGGAVWYLIFTQKDNITTIVYNNDKKAAEEKKKEEEAKKGLKTYTNLSALFSFDYPDTWALAENYNAIYLSSDKDYPANYLAGKMPERKDSEIYIQIHFSNEPVDVGREAPAIKPKYSNPTIGGIEAERVTYKNEVDFQDFIHALKSGDFYFIIICDTKTANSEKIEAYNKMLGSFKFGENVVKS